MAGRALVLGGTGMLAGCVAALVGDGWHVVLPSRRYAPIPAEPLERGDYQPGAFARGALAGGRGHKPTANAERKALWVQADWSEPDQLAARAQHALGGPADLLVAWVHSADRAAVMHAVRPLLAEGAPVVEVLGSGATTGDAPDPVLADHPTQQVVLGYVNLGGRTRWLTHDEIAEGVLAAVRRALEGRPPAAHQVGEVPMPYGHRP
ncbi:hypothetical protein [Labedaea rhizosphaerae]|nr:hypothetical protein [Labedaea rhizosphaerae]